MASLIYLLPSTLQEYPRFILAWCVTIPVISGSESKVEFLRSSPLWRLLDTRPSHYRHLSSHSTIRVLSLSFPWYFPYHLILYPLIFKRRLMDLTPQTFGPPRSVAGVTHGNVIWTFISWDRTTGWDAYPRWVEYQRVLLLWPRFILLRISNRKP